VKARHLALTDFALYSVGINLTRRDKHDVYADFLSDTMADSGVTILRLSLDDHERLLDIARQFNLDFDDAYQYVAAEKYDLTLVSFAGDFNRTERGRQTPAQALAALAESDAEA
jgi:predicted nucleic acid-binding protein